MYYYASDSEEEGDAEQEEREHREEVARANYKLAIRTLARSFPHLNIPAAGLIAGLHAREQETRSCPCGAGLLARWPWVPLNARLGFCPGAVLGEEPNHCKCGKHFWEIINWRSEWVEAWPGGRHLGLFVGNVPSLCVVATSNSIFNFARSYLGCI